MNEHDQLAVDVVVIGLGYVGLTLGVALAQRGLKVIGVEKRADVVEMTNAGCPHFSEAGLGKALASVLEAGTFRAAQQIDPAITTDYYIITVGTPLVAGTTTPRLDMIEQAVGEVAGHMGDGACVILRSTVKFGTTREIVRPILAATGKRFDLSMCPERTLEGAALQELATLPQIVSGETPQAVDRAASLFGKLTNSIVRVSTLETAELIKLIDNTSRDVRFAFANEVARACDALGVDAGEVIRSGKLGYVRTDVAMPGLVGGPCLEKDPHILLASVEGAGIDLEITRSCRMVNERQPMETVAAIMERLRQRGPGPYRVAVAGIAFKGRPETNDLRGSMSIKVIECLRAQTDVGEIVLYDGVVSREDLLGLGLTGEVRSDLLAACDGAHCLVIGNNHPEYGGIDIGQCVAAMQPGGFIYDYWAHLVERPAPERQGRYYVVGNNKEPS